MPDLRTAFRRLRERWTCRRHGHVLEPDRVLARGLILMVVECSRCGRGLLWNAWEQRGIELSPQETRQKAADLRGMCDRRRKSHES